MRKPKASLYLRFRTREGKQSPYYTGNGGGVGNRAKQGKPQLRDSLVTHQIISIVLKMNNMEGKRR
jgi:hypothetical protein